MKHSRHFFIAFFAVTVIGTPWIISAYPQSARFVDNLFAYVGKNYSATFFQESITVKELQDKYDAISRSKRQPKIRIVLVPGHEPEFGGTEFGNVKEREVNVELSNYLKEFLSNNSHYEVIVARDHNSWNPLFDQYFKDHWDEISSFVKESKTEMIRLVNDGSVKKMYDGVIHNNAPANVALRLYGINKWNNENKVDMVVHVHFNDYPRKNMSTPGKYSGLAIYVPEGQYSNSTTTRAIAETIFKRLTKYNAISNLPTEEAGVVEEQELIAIGSYNTLDAPSMLIEYGYIYEPQITDTSVRESTLKDLAFQTYLGIQDFFGSGNDVSLAYDTLMLPYKWQENISEDSQNKTEILALQSAFILEGLYPPGNKSKNDCPRTGKFGPCTLSALSDFQNKYGITNEKNIVGEQTKDALNKIYSKGIR